VDLGFVCAMLPSSSKALRLTIRLVRVQGKAAVDFNRESAESAPVLRAQVLVRGGRAWYETGLIKRARAIAATIS